MKKHKIILFVSLIIIMVLGGSSVYAMTQQEVDKYNNIYYPQSGL